MSLVSTSSTYAVPTRRKITNRVAAVVITACFLVALVPVASLLWTVVSRGLARLDLTFFTSSMRGVISSGGGAIHAITGTALITGATVVVSVPIGVATATYLIEYGQGVVPRVIRFLTDVMTGIPSIV
ncbi:MAG: phosphate ABC transporter, permease protein PstA, partial [Propionibacteriaceae bacterium]|nr:phosphate ABC transporter, permease protein PstA [Propionibacteriaceae bacterium]